MNTKEVILAKAKEVLGVKKVDEKTTFNNDEQKIELFTQLDMTFGTSIAEQGKEGKVTMVGDVIRLYEEELAM